MPAGSADPSLSARLESDTPSSLEGLTSFSSLIFDPAAAEKLSVLITPSADSFEASKKELISLLSLYTSEVISAAKAYDPTRVTRYVTSVATLFHKFYNACRVKGGDEGLMQARMALCDCTRAVIKNVLTMFNINCPDSM